MGSGKFVWFTTPGSKLLYEFPIWLKDEDFVKKNSLNSFRFSLTIETNTKQKVQFLNDKTHSYTVKPFGTWQFFRMGVLKFFD